MTDISWRKAQLMDLPRIVAIYNQAVSHGIATDDDQPQTVESQRGWFQSFDDQYPLWVVMVDSQVVGWVGLELFFPHPNFAHSVQISIYFDDQFHHQGLGTKTLQFIDQQACHLGIKTIISYIYERNKPSQRLFASQGYHYVGELTDVAKIRGEYRSVETYLKNF
ncbi:MAG TPA: GNAT family N-acetyltransferase [Candidatus Limosilactobacillus merdipullorum]|uniref:GNAT family N-acetyltransferase n=1 Tax=Candidatus Limosilactobacillus merdipullorum TaxID=2838653 RepID=A0A9D1QNT7_9LACO|nr:GNAT family N-acetyltransferase [Candidatus Limosilactobacillus merdipullorum]